MTDKLPPNLLALFAARPPLRFLPPADHPPEDRRCHAIEGVGAYVSRINEVFGDYKPTESWPEAKDRRKIEKQKHREFMVGEGHTDLFKPGEDANVRGDPFRTLFVGRLSYDTDIKDLEREFGRFGPIDRIRTVSDTGESDSSEKKMNKKSRKGKSMGYGFVVFDREQDMKGTVSVLSSDYATRANVMSTAAYKETDHLVIRGKKVLVDVERGRTVAGWRPKRFGGGLGGRHYTKAPPPRTMFGGPPPGPGGFRGGMRGGFGNRGGFDRGGFDRGGGGFRGRGGGFRGGFGGDQMGGRHEPGRDYGSRPPCGGGRGGIGFNGAPDGAPAGPRSGGGGGYSGGGGGGGGGGGYNDRDGGRNGNVEPWPSRNDRYRTESTGGGGGGGYSSGQKRPYDGGGGGGYDESRSRRRY